MRNELINVLALVLMSITILFTVYAFYNSMDFITLLWFASLYIVDAQVLPIIFEKNRRDYYRNSEE